MSQLLARKITKLGFSCCGPSASREIHRGGGGERGERSETAPRRATNRRVVEAALRM